MRKLIIDICTILNLIKNFTAGYSTMAFDKMMIDHDGKRYMVTFEELCDVDEEDMFKTMNRYWKR